MMGRVIVMEPADYQAWLAAGGTPAARPVIAGQQLYNALACSTCHQAGDAKRAPTLAGLFGTQVPLLGGGSALADETYLRESILEPSAKVVAGFQPIMPTYKGQLSEEQLYQLITYLKTLEAARVDAPAGEARTQG
jgi:cytochrome c oxidase subunit 2